LSLQWSRGVRSDPSDITFLNQLKLAALVSDLEQPYTFQSALGVRACSVLLVNNCLFLVFDTRVLSCALLGV
ncbi:hypothetical protein J6590_107992, partial [Homalodisca vitripennis]